MKRAALLENGPLRLKQCRHGSMLYLATDAYIGRSLDRYGEFSEGEVEVFRQIVRPQMVVLDIGANIGAHTICFARAVGPRGAVFAFEPQRIIFQLLCANVAVNGLTNVHTHHVAVGKICGTLLVPVPDYSRSLNFGGVALGDWPQGESVRVVTVDSLQLPACHLLKVDVEGMEGDVLAGAVETIGKHRPAVYVENDRPAKSQALIEQLFALDYRLYWHLPRLFNPQNYFQEPENIFADTISANMLGFPRTVGQEVQGLREIQSPDDDWRRPEERR